MENMLAIQESGKNYLTFDIMVESNSSSVYFDFVVIHLVLNKGEFFNRIFNIQSGDYAKVIASLGSSFYGYDITASPDNNEITLTVLNIEHRDESGNLTKPLNRVRITSKQKLASLKLEINIQMTGVV